VEAARARARLNPLPCCCCMPGSGCRACKSIVEATLAGSLLREVELRSVWLAAMRCARARAFATRAQPPPHPPAHQNRNTRLSRTPANQLISPSSFTRRAIEADAGCAREMRGGAEEGKETLGLASCCGAEACRPSSARQPRARATADANTCGNEASAAAASRAKR
jgi:hypothetical protein